LRHLTVSTFSVTTILTVAVWLTQSLRLLDALINRGVSLLTFVKMIVLLLPDLVSIIFPISVLLATLFTYNRLLIDNELIIMRAAGVNDFKLIQPVLMIALLVTGILYAINLYLLPLAFQHFKDLEYRIRNTINVGMIQPGEFNAFKDIMVYVHNRQKDGTMTGILIHDARNPAKSYAVTAEFGKVMNTPEGTRLILIHGSRQELDPETGVPSILSFAQYSVDLNMHADNAKSRPRKPYERFLADLLDPQDTQNDPTARQKLHVEVHQRLLMPLTTLIFVLIALAIFFSGDYNRRGRTRKIAGAIGLCTAIEGLILSLIHLSEKFTIAALAAYMLVIVSFLLPLLYFVRRSRNTMGKKAV
jgi:lipopolysaccharide export system permease protein